MPTRKSQVLLILMVGFAVEFAPWNFSWWNLSLSANPAEASQNKSSVTHNPSSPDDTLFLLPTLSAA